MRYTIPGHNSLEINTIILDLNGTLSIGGKIPDGVKERIEQLKKMGFNLILFTGNTRNDADELAKDLGIEWRLAKTAEDKQDLAIELGAESSASIGNGLIDVELTKTVRLGVVTIQAEGVHTKTLEAADIIVPTINDALDLFLDPDRLIATLRR